MSDEARELAIEGLEMGYRLIARELNKSLSKRGLKILSDPAQENDSISTAVDNMKRGLSQITRPLSWPAELTDMPPWTLGYLNGRDNKPRMLTLGEIYLEAIQQAGDFLDDSKRHWVESDWLNCIVGPVEQYQEFMIQELRGYKWSEWHAKKLCRRLCKKTWKAIKEKRKKPHEFIVESNPQNTQEFRFRLNPEWKG